MISNLDISLLSTNFVLAGLAGSAFVLVLLDYVRVLRLRRNLPPGPFPLPIVGNHFSFPARKPWLEFKQWSEEYYGSTMITMWLGRVPYIICNDAWTASDLMDKRANIYSSRPHMIGMGDVILATNSNQTALPYGDQWRMHRKLMHNVVGQQAIGTHRRVQELESAILAQELLKDPENHAMAIERYSCSVVSIIGWGRRVASGGDYVLGRAIDFMEGANLIIPGAFWFESVPELLRLPTWLYSTGAAITGPMRGLKSYFYRLAHEGAQASESNFSTLLISQQKKLGLTNDEVSDLTALLIGGGDSRQSFCHFRIKLKASAEVMKKAQMEIDSVVGSDHSPDANDEASLPYTIALVKESLRWSSVATLGGIPHSNISDDVYNGYFIPKGSWIVGNSYAIHRNSKDFAEPEHFRPERYMDGLERPYPNEKGHSAFGWGRRACSGQPLAVQGLVITIVKLLWAFDILPGLDASGKEVKLSQDHKVAYTDSENTRPKPFSLRLIARSDKIKQLIIAEAESAAEELSVYDGDSKVRL